MWLNLICKIKLSFIDTDILKYLEMVKGPPIIKVILFNIILFTLLFLLFNTKYIIYITTLYIIDII